MTEPVRPSADAASAGPSGPEQVSVRAALERQLALLGRLAEAGLNIALTVERRALAAEVEADGAGPAEAGERQSGEVALAYARVSRAVRLTVALQGRVIKELQALDDEAVRREIRARADAASKRQQAQVQRKARVERIVERLIQAEASDEAEADRLADEAYERLEGDDIYGDLMDRPVREVIAQICRDLGLAPDWTRLAQEAWAQEAWASDGLSSEPAVTTPTRVRWLDAAPPEPAFAPSTAGEPRGASP